MKKILVFVAPLFLFTSCYDDFDYELPDAKPKLVVDARVIEGEPIQRVRLTLTSNKFFNDDALAASHSLFLTNAPAVRDAVVILSDDRGLRDTLIPGPAYDYRYFMRFPGRTWDSIWEKNVCTIDYGFYQTRKFRGEVGRTYFLEIYWQGEIYRSSCTMPPIPPIDSITIIPLERRFFMPLAWFDNPPQTQDYFLFTPFPISTWTWGCALLSDKNLGPRVEGFDIFQRVINYELQNYPEFDHPYYYCEMYSISKEVYDYYDAAILLHKNDGGVYSPNPALPPSNISNGALGVFMAASINRIWDAFPFSSISRANL